MLLHAHPAQEVRLHEGLNPGSQGLALLLYQFSTLQFIRGLLPEARELTQRSLALSETAFANEPDQAGAACPPFVRPHACHACRSASASHSPCGGPC